jgi:hypothetical protein
VARSSKSLVGPVFAALFLAGALALLISGGLRFRAHHDGHHAVVSATVESAAKACYSKGCHRTSYVGYSVSGTAQHDVPVVDADWDEGSRHDLLVDTDSPRKAIRTSDQGFLRMVVGLVLAGFAVAVLRDGPTATP